MYTQKEIRFRGEVLMKKSISVIMGTSILNIGVATSVYAKENINIDNNNTYNQMIDSMRNNGYEGMAEIMNSVGREEMINMHNTMIGR